MTLAFGKIPRSALKTVSVAEVEFSDRNVWSVASMI